MLHVCPHRGKLTSPSPARVQSVIIRRNSTLIVTTANTDTLNGTNLCVTLFLPPCPDNYIKHRIC